MSFLLRPDTPRYEAQLRARALEAVNHEADAAGELEGLSCRPLAEAA
jgi:hypothetical protein